jgi:hypothetical protein
LGKWIYNVVKADYMAKKMKQQINREAELGWELVTASSDGGTGVLLYFKKETQQSNV